MNDFSEQPRAANSRLSASFSADEDASPSSAAEPDVRPPEAHGASHPRASGVSHPLSASVFLCCTLITSPSAKTLRVTTQERASD